MSQLTNPHYLYVYSGVATQDQMVDYIKECLIQFQNVLKGSKIEKTFLVNVVRKYDGTYQNHSYLWFKSEKTASLFLNKDLSGNERLDEVPDPEHDVSEADRIFQDFLNAKMPEGARWEDIVEEEERLLKNTIQRTKKTPKQPMIEFPVIIPNDEQKMKYPDLDKIKPDFFPCKIFTRPGYLYNKLYAIHITKDVQESVIRKAYEPFATKREGEGKDAKKYPIVHIDRRTAPHSATVSFAPGTMDAVFAMMMVKKVAITEKCMLNFDLYREN